MQVERYVIAGIDVHKKMLAVVVTDAAKLAGITDKAVRATPEQLQDALCAAATLHPLHRQILRLILEGPS